MSHTLSLSGLLTALAGVFWLLPCAGAPVVVAVEPAQGAPKAAVEVPITVRGAEGLGALQMELLYDPAILQATGVKEGPIAPAAMADWKVGQPGRLRLALANQQPVKADGGLLIVTFTVLGHAGQECALAIENARAWTHGAGLPMLVNAEPGKFTVRGSAVPWVYVGIGAGVLVVVVLASAAAKRKKPRAPDSQSTP